MVSGSLSLPSPGCFSPFPRGTRPLSVVAGTAPWGVVPPASDGLPRAPPYSRSLPTARPTASPTGLSPAPVALSSRVRLATVGAAAALQGAPADRTTPAARRLQPTCTRRVWAWSPFARHYSGSPSPLLGVLRCFSSPGSRSPAYVFSRERRPITGGGLPHSGTPGSMRALPLPGAFRSAPRPSSASSAQASPTYALSLGAYTACAGCFSIDTPRTTGHRPGRRAGRRYCLCFSL